MCYEGAVRCMITWCSGFVVFTSTLNSFKCSSSSLLFVFAGSM